MPTAKYIKKSAVVYADRWTHELGTSVDGVVYDAPTGRYCLETLNGPTRMFDGDFVVTDAAGRRMRVTAAVFFASFENYELLDKSEAVR